MRIRGARPSGHTIIELIIVIVLLGAVALAVTPLGNVMPQIRLQSAAERLAADLKYSQALARKEGGHVGVVVEPASNRYSVVRQLVNPVVNPMDTGTNLQMSFGADSRFTGVTILSASFGGSATVQFDNLGGPRDASYAPLAAAGQIILGLGADRETVEVSAVTGRVSF